MTRLNSLIPMSGTGIKLPKASFCLDFSKEMGAEENKVKPTQKSAMEIATSVLEREGRDLSIVERVQLPNYILDPEFQDYQPKFANLVLKDYSKGKRFWRRLLNSWIHNFQLDTRTGKLVRDTLRKNSGEFDEKCHNLIVSFPAILGNKSDLKNLAETILNSRSSVKALPELGLKDGNRSTDFASSVLTEAVKLVCGKNAPADWLDSFKMLVAPRKEIHESVEMFAMVGLIIGSGERSPGDKRVKEIASLVERNFGDPVTAEKDWSFVSAELGGDEKRKECIDRARQWQVFRSINFFFKIIERVVVDSEHQHHFPDRRDFWLKYFDQGSVSDAWVILGSKARDEIDRIVSRDNEDYKSLRWGKLFGGPSDQCALLMRVGNTTVMEFSHSGRARIWDDNQRVRSRAPRLHNDRYRTDELRADCPEGQMFRHDPQGRWRIKVQRLLDRKISGRTAI